jgi:hypothetical protein
MQKKGLIAYTVNGIHTALSKNILRYLKCSLKAISAFVL